MGDMPTISEKFRLKLDTEENPHSKQIKEMGYSVFKSKRLA